MRQPDFDDSVPERGATTIFPLIAGLIYSAYLRTELIDQISLKGPKWFSAFGYIPGRLR